MAGRSARRVRAVLVAFTVAGAQVAGSSGAASLRAAFAVLAGFAGTLAPPCGASSQVLVGDGEGRSAGGLGSGLHF